MAVPFVGVAAALTCHSSIRHETAICISSLVEGGASRLWKGIRGLAFVRHQHFKNFRMALEAFCDSDAGRKSPARENTREILAEDKARASALPWQEPIVPAMYPFLRTYMP